MSGTLDCSESDFDGLCGVEISSGEVGAFFPFFAFLI